MTEAMTLAALSWLRYDKSCDIVCTEIGNNYIKDVFGLYIGENGLPASSVEIEVKASKYDLLRDFDAKAKKHELYSKGIGCPTYMYFLVPDKMVEHAKEFVRAKDKRYGLLAFDPQIFLDNGGHPIGSRNCISSVLRVSKLTNEKPSPQLMYQMGRRLVNEYFMLKYAVHTKLNSIDTDIKFYAKQIAWRESGKVDPHCPFKEQTT